MGVSPNLSKKRSSCQCSSKSESRPLQQSHFHAGHWRVVHSHHQMQSSKRYSQMEFLAPGLRNPVSYLAQNGREHCLARDSAQRRGCRLYGRGLSGFHSENPKGQARRYREGRFQLSGTALTSHFFSHRARQHVRAWTHDPFRAAPENTRLCVLWRQLRIWEHDPI